MQLSEARRLDVIAEGLELLVENVATLGEDLGVLSDAKRPRGLRMLAGQANEEAAKALILLDLVRMDPKDSAGMGRQVKHFYNHLARRIYAEMVEMRPATFGEARKLIDSMRRSRYLDGPNDVDWTFRNRPIAEREESLYVDYVHDEEGDRWLTPASQDGVLFGDPFPGARDLVASLHRLGCTSREGLTIIAKAWRSQRIAETTHWQEVRAINRSIVDELLDRKIAGADATAEDQRRAIDTWPFPLASIELGEIEVSDAELQAEQERWAPN